MTMKSTFAAACLLAAVSFTASAESQFNATLAGLADDESGRSTDVDMSFAPNESWRLDAGAGSTKARSDVADIEGTSLRAGVELHSQRFAVRGYYSQYSDSNDFDMDMIGARASIFSGGFSFSAIVESRGFDVQYTSGTVLNPTTGTANFDGNGYGAGFSYAAGNWSSYVDLVFYDFGSRVDNYVTTSRGPSILRIPAVAGLSGSIVTLKQGALDRQFTAGLERGFQRTSLLFNWTGVKDAISGATSNTFSAGLRYSLSQRSNLGFTLGMTDTDFGSVNFAGASVGWSL